VFFAMDWAACKLTQRASLQLKSPGIAAVAVRQDGRIAASAGWDKQLRVWHYAKARPLAVLQYHRAGLTDVAFHARTQRLASASRDGSIALWSVYANAGGAKQE
jgi:WD40 repeat protein